MRYAVLSCAASALTPKQMTCVVSQGDVSVTILQFPTLAKFREGIAKKDKFKDFCTKNPDFRVKGACDGNTLAEVDEEEVYAYIIKNKNPCFTLVLGAFFSFCLPLLTPLTAAPGTPPAQPSGACPPFVVLRALCT